MILGDNLGAAAILAALPDDVDTEVSGDLIRVVDGESAWTLRSVWIGAGFPSDYFRRDIPDPEPGVTDVITARKLSKGTRQLLRPSGLSWADLSGRASLRSSPGLLIERGAAQQGSDLAVVRWSDSAGAAAETILALDLRNRLHDRERSVSAAELAELTSYSYPQINKVLQMFEATGYIANIGTERGSTAKRVLVEPARLLSDWGSWYAQRVVPSTNFHTVWRDVSSSIDLLQHSVDTGWAVSGWWAADRVAPFTTTVPTLTCYVDRSGFAETVERIRGHVAVEPVETDGRLILSPAEPHVLRLAGSADGVPLADPVRIYGDLLRLGARGDEAGQHLREKVFGY